MPITKAAYLEISGLSSTIVSYWLEGGFLTPQDYVLNSRTHLVWVRGDSSVDAGQAIEKLSAFGGANVNLVLPTRNRGGFDRKSTAQLIRAVAGALVHEAVHTDQRVAERAKFEQQSTEQAAWVAEQQNRFGLNPDTWPLSPEEWLHGYYRDFETEPHAVQVAVERLFPDATAPGVAETKLRQRLGSRFHDSGFGSALHAAIFECEVAWACYAPSTDV